jgi:hypothetical protein
MHGIHNKNTIVHFNALGGDSLYNGFFVQDSNSQLTFIFLFKLLHSIFNTPVH